MKERSERDLRLKIKKNGRGGGRGNARVRPRPPTKAQDKRGKGHTSEARNTFDSIRFRRCEHARPTPPSAPLPDPASLAVGLGSEKI